MRAHPLPPRPLETVVAKDRILLVGRDGSGVCLDRATGQLRFRLPRIGYGPDQASPVLTAAGDDAIVQALPRRHSTVARAHDLRTGHRRWKITLPTRITALDVLSNGKVLCGDARGRLLALDQVTGDAEFLRQLVPNPIQVLLVRGRQTYVASGVRLVRLSSTDLTVQSHVDLQGPIEAVLPSEPAVLAVLASRAVVGLRHDDLQPRWQ